MAKTLSKCHFEIRTTGLSEKNIEILFQPNERLFDFTHKTSIQSASLCVLPPIFYGRRYRKWQKNTLIQKSGSVLLKVHKEVRAYMC